ncbi:response regulator [Singulisphaera sp. PoT]|uniref:response regulator n=1 Tax=Singulisphaera sp. PoT TaxID=3411797 RepID=UPI003BF4C2FF
MIVEDHATTRRALELMFRQSGWTVATAATMQDGLRLLESQPNYVFLDLMLPDGDGELLIQKARALNSPTRFIVTTGCSDPTRLESIRKMSLHAVLQKPLNFAKIASVVAD